MMINITMADHIHSRLHNDMLRRGFYKVWCCFYLFIYLSYFIISHLFIILFSFVYLFIYVFIPFLFSFSKSRAKVSRCTVFRCVFTDLRDTPCNKQECVSVPFIVAELSLSLLVHRFSLINIFRHHILITFPSSRRWEMSQTNFSKELPCRVPGEAFFVFFLINICVDCGRKCICI